MSYQFFYTVILKKLDVQKIVSASETDDISLALMFLMASSISRYWKNSKTIMFVCNHLTLYKYFSYELLKVNRLKQIFVRLSELVCLFEYVDVVCNMHFYEIQTTSNIFVSSSPMNIFLCSQACEHALKKSLMRLSIILLLKFIHIFEYI